ncbi:hypothetical protein [Hyphomonas chukchiensis]|uniref:YraN family protein n=1 Tax=Hyphomonas chukchiensis TaxID=1280947 RepID=A0A062UIS0_9PROT|nr:hypothetical protein [Hyphomonas chukchiensis]KCZ58891.1 hypothetical protein HY30_03895 [Hyphomonas chukchiensis]
MAEGARQRAERRGRAAETRAALWLRLKGYRILETRLRMPVGGSGPDRAAARPPARAYA